MLQEWSIKKAYKTDHNSGYNRKVLTCCFHWHYRIYLAYLQQPWLSIVLTSFSTGMETIRENRQYLKSVSIRSCSGPHFHAFRLNTERYSASLCTQLDNFYAVQTKANLIFFAEPLGHQTDNLVATRFISIGISFDKMLKDLC